MPSIDLNDLPLITVTVVWLVFLEGLFSADNALVLATMVRHLPKAEQKRALRYGMWGAFIFRFIAVLLAKVLLDFWYLKVAGGLYLVYLAASHFLSRSSQDGTGSSVKRFGKGFWGTVVSVELADIAFSIDSILAAVAIASGLPPERVGESEKVAIVVTGGILGIITMRFVAGYFIILLEKWPGLETGAYGLVAWIGLQLIAGGLHNAKFIKSEMDERVFWIGMVAILVTGFLYRPKSPPPSEDTVELAHKMTRMGGGDDGEDGGPEEVNSPEGDSAEVRAGVVPAEPVEPGPPLG